MLVVALYKSQRPGVAGLYNRFVRFWEQGSYSHCELVFSDGMSASSSFEDGGIRFKKIEYSPDRWDLVEIDPSLEHAAREWFGTHQGKKYDILGNIRFCLGFLGHSRNRYFCSEAVASALGLQDPWRFGPNGLSAVLPLLKTQK